MSPEELLQIYEADPEYAKDALADIDMSDDDRDMYNSVLDQLMSDEAAGLIGKDDEPESNNEKSDEPKADELKDYNNCISNIANTLASAKW